MQINYSCCLKTKYPFKLKCRDISFPISEKHPTVYFSWQSCCQKGNESIIPNESSHNGNFPKEVPILGLCQQSHICKTWNKPSKPVTVCRLTPPQSEECQSSSSSFNTDTDPSLVCTNTAKSTLRLWSPPKLPA